MGRPLVSTNRRDCLRAALIALMLTLQIGSSACSRSPAAAPSAQEAADAIWFNGTIITIDDRQPSAQAVASRDGRIIAVGARDDVMKHKGPQTRLHDLRGRTLLPGFIDAHGHVSMVGFQALCANLLPPPDGPNGSIAELQNTLREYI